MDVPARLKARDALPRDPLFLAPYLREVRPTLLLALPIMVGQVCQILIGVTDSLMIGRAGTVPLAASAFGMSIFTIFYVVGIGLMLPVSIFVARAHGANAPSETTEYLRHGLVLALVFGALETLILFGLGTQLHRFGQPPEVIAIVRPFFLLIGASVTPVLVYLVFRQFAEALGRPWAPMFIILGDVALNVFLNWVLIYGNLGLPALGLTGAGIATLLARTAGTLVLLYWVRHDPRLRVYWPAQWWAPLSKTRVLAMLHVGVPAASMLFFECTAFAFSCIMVGWLGAVPLAAHQIALSCASFSFMFPLGLSTAAGIRISRALGAGERQRLRPIGYSALGIALLMTATFGLLFAFAGRPLAGLFVRDPSVISLAVQLLVIAGLFQLFDGAQVNGAALLRGITDVRVPAVITFAAYWIAALPLGYVLGIRAGWGARGIWIGIASGLACAAVLLAIRFARRARALETSDSA